MVVVDADNSKKFCQLHEKGSVTRVLMQGLIFFGLLLFFINALADENTERKYYLDIQQQSVARALTRLSEQADVQVFFPYNLTKGKTANAIKGNFTVLQALDLMLKGSGLHGDVSKNGVLTIFEGELDVDRISTGEQSMNNKKNILAAAIAFLGALGGAQVQGQEPGEAQSNDELATLETIVVTASRREENLQDTALSISVVTPQDFLQSGLIRLDDVITYTPGFALSNPQGLPGSGGSISARGASQTSNVSGVVGIYVDDIPLAGSSPLSASSLLAFDGLLGDIERIELIKGPQGTLYGASAIGGALKYVTRKPSLDEVRGRVSMNLSTTKNGGFNQIYSGRFSSPIIEETLGVTVVGYYDDNEGFVDQIDAASGARLDDGIDAFERFGVSGDLYFEPTDLFNARLRVLYQENEFSGLIRVDLDPGTNNPAFGELASTQGASSGMVENTLISGTINYQADWATLTFTGSYIDNEWETNQDFFNRFGAAVDLLFEMNPEGTTTSVPSVSKFPTEKTVQEVRITSPTSDDIEWIVGFYHVEEDSGISEQTITALPTGFNLLDARFPTEYEEYAAFGNFTYYFMPNFDATIGARYSDLSSRTEQIDTGHFAGQDAATDYDGDISTWLFSARYRPSEFFSVYTRIASGYRPAFAVLSFTDPAGGFTNPPFVEEDEVWSYEIGAKGSAFDAMLSFDVAAFYIDWDNYQAHFVNSLNFGSTINASGGVTVQGLEGSFVLSLYDGFTWTSSFTYTESTFNEDEPLLGARDGQQVPFVPEWQAVSKVQYRFDVTTDVTGFIDAGVRYEDEAPGFDLDSSTSVTSDSYAIVDLSAGVEFGGVSLSVYAVNLLDKVEYTTIRTSGGPTGVPTRPRTIGAVISYDF